MSTTSFLLVMSAAALHATWNAIVKGSVDRLVANWAIVTAAAIVNLPLLVIVGLPTPDVWPYLLGSVTAHTAYNLALVVAYTRADLAVAYPVARGSAPIIVTVGGALLLDDPTPVAGVTGVLLVSISLLVLVSNRPRRDTTWAAITGLTIATYTMFDGAGVRANGDSLQYIGVGFVLHASVLTAIVLWRRGPAVMRRAAVAQPLRLLGGGACSAGAYLLVMYVARTEPLGLVAGLRETSALFGVAIGALVLGESVNRRHAMAVVAAVAGTALIAIS